MVLFTHLKIILLQCLQFSIFNKISGIQTHPKYLFVLFIIRYVCAPIYIITKISQFSTI